MDLILKKEASVMTDIQGDITNQSNTDSQI